MLQAILSRALVACAALSLFLTACGKDDPKSIFPARASTKVILRSPESGESLRVIHIADDKVTPRFAEIELSNGHSRVAVYRKGKLASTREYFAPVEGQNSRRVYFEREYEEDGSLHSEQRYREDGSVELKGHRLRSHYYDQTYFGIAGNVTKHQVFTNFGYLVAQEVYWDNGVIKERTTSDMNLTQHVIFTYDEEGTVVFSTTKDNDDSTIGKAIYYPGGKEIRIKAEKSGYQSTVTYYRENGTIEQRWTRGAQTIVIEFVDQSGATTYRKNLLHYRMRLGAPAKLSDWRVFSVDELDKSGNLKRTIVFNADNRLPITVLQYENHSDVSNFEGIIKSFRHDGTLETVKYHARNGKEVLKEKHFAAEKIREPVKPNYKQDADGRLFNRTV